MNTIEILGKEGSLNLYLYIQGWTDWAYSPISLSHTERSRW